MKQHRQYNLWIASVCLLVTIVYIQNDAYAYEQACLQAFPSPIQARLEARDRRLNETIGNRMERFSPFFVRRLLSTWNPGQTITVAFKGGSYDLLKGIAETAANWTRYANLKLDFGHDADAKTFRQWSTTDTAFAADIRISFDGKGYWSQVGTDSNNPQILQPNDPSMNFGGFALYLPQDWKGTVLHEFGHALGFEHEHQHPAQGCDGEFRWYDEPGYIPTTDRLGQYIRDVNGKLPGIYTVLGGPPNRWQKSIVDFNLKQLKDSRAYDYGQFDSDSIMKYFFPEWMFSAGKQSHCYNQSWNEVLSQADIVGATRAYPKSTENILSITENRTKILNKMMALENLPSAFSMQVDKKLRSIKAMEY